jgi:hypothetical protein
MMLLPVRVSPNRRIWIDVSFRYEKQVYAGALEDLTRYVLKSGHVDGVYEDEQIAYDVKRTIAGMLRDGIPRRQAVEETSALYGIPIGCVEEVVDEVSAAIPI